MDTNENLVYCSAASITLQSAYDGGNTITSTDARDIDIIFDDTAVDSNFDIDLVADNTVSISRNASASSESPAQLLLLENLDDDITVADALLIQSTGNNDITDAIDASDTEIVNALNFGANTILGTTGNIDMTNFDVVGSSGDVTTAGDVAINGGDLTSSQSTFNLLSTNVTTLNIGDIASTNFGGGYTGGGSGVTITAAGALSINNNLLVDGTSQLTGNVTTSGDLFVNGDDINSDGDLTISAAGGNILTGNALNVGGAAAAAFNFFGDSTTNATSVTGDNDLYVEDVLEVDGGAFFTPSGTADITFTQDADSSIVLGGTMNTATGDILCLDTSDNLVIFDDAQI